MLKNGRSTNEVRAGRLNIFQRTMLDWNDTLAYNAVHVVRVPAPLELERLTSVVNRIVERRGLSGLTLNRDRGTYHYHAGPARCDIAVILAETGDRCALYAEVERQLNLAFVPGELFKPFRFFVAPEAGGFSLGLTYFHAVADAESFVLLMKELVESYLQRPSAISAQPIELYPACYDNLLRQQPALLARKLSAIPALVRDLRMSSRPPYRNGQLTTHGFTFCSLAPDAVGRLTAAAKSWGVTLNDLFLGLLMKSLGLLASDRTLAPKRRSISVGCIVNTRKALGLQAGSTFGSFLGSFVVTHEVPEQIALRDLVADLHRQTARVKRHKLYVGAPLEMGVARFVLSLLSVERGKKLYHRYYPLWGGITNMNLNALWDQPNRDQPIDYFRAVSTSPVTPLVLSLTTSGNVMNIGFTYRSTAFLPAEMERIKGHFLGQANHPEVAA